MAKNGKSGRAGPFVMAVDVGTASLRAGLVACNGRLAFSAIQPTAGAKGGSVAQTLVETCRDVLQQSGVSTRELVGVGCCTPGCVDPESGVIVATAIPSWQGVDVRTPLERAFEREVAVEGEGNAAALTAWTFGPARNHSPLLALAVGAGIEAGYILEGKLLRGAGNAALEAGHMRLFHPGRICTCGRRGCWQAHAGGGALISLLAEYRAAGHQLPALPEEIAELALAHHEVCLSIWEEQGVLLGIGIGVLLDILNPRTVVLGGTMMRSWGLFKKVLLKTAREKALGRNAEAAIVCAPDPEWTSLLGAAVAAVRAQGKPDFFVDAGTGAA
jgi:glucokinase